jgi:DNA polymerase III gamma/tau subunit
VILPFFLGFEMVSIYIPVCSTKVFISSLVFFCHDYAVSEVGIKKLRHALKILSETEKQLRTSRNQATWVTVALLQFSTNEPNPVAETNDMHAHSVTGYTGNHTNSQYPM